MLHLDDGVPLVVHDPLLAENVLVQQFLELKQGSGLVPTNIAQIIGAGTADGKGLGVLIFLDIDLIEGVIVIILHPERYRVQQFIMFNKLYVSDSMDLLASPDHFISPAIINKFQKVR